jgi:hypothetical protein
MTRARLRATRVPGPLVGLGLVAALVAATLAGCGASPAAVGPTGIDELTIPTPTPDPADFTGHVENAWFPLETGTEWTYRDYLPTGYRTVVATVLARRRQIAGVATTAVRWQVRDHRGRRTALVRWYAVDAGGDVWWFGQHVAAHAPRLDPLAPRSWLAGRDGAEAGLVLSATPRVGDGYLNASQPRVVERRSTVESVSATVSTPEHEYRHTVVTQDLSALAPLHVVMTYFARDLGMVAQEDTRATSSSLVLLRMRHG